MSQDFIQNPEITPHVGAVYAHYRDRSKQYRVTGISLNSDTDEWHVEYVPLYEGAVAPKFNRSIVSWFDNPEVDGVVVERYSLVSLE